jgi:RNA polymerase sigma factor (sigma-70 family)
MHSGVHQAIATVWRLESARITASVARVVRDIGVAEELAQDALVAALEHWPRDGVPDNPAAWLMTTAKRRALDHLRHRQMADARHEDIAADLEALGATHVPDFVDALDEARQDDIGDDLLRLVFTACHPVLSTDARVALTLKLLGGLTTHEIARAFLVPEATIAQRIVRAKRTLSDAGVPYEVPRGPALGERLASVLEVVYLVFNEGYTATSGGDWMRPALCDEALRLGRMLAGIAPQQPEVHGLLALMEIQASRTAARTDAQGRPVLLNDQDRSRWDHLLIRRGLDALARADLLTAAPGPYHLQGAIAACHGRAPPTPTGRASPRCTASSPAWPRRRWSSSTARWPSPCTPARPRAWCWSMPCSRTRPCASTTGCPACAVTCWPGWAATARRAPNSSARRISRATSARRPS